MIFIQLGQIFIIHIAVSHIKSTQPTTTIKRNKHPHPTARPTIPQHQVSRFQQMPKMCPTIMLTARQTYLTTLGHAHLSKQKLHNTNITQFTQFKLKPIPSIPYYEENALLLANDQSTWPAPLLIQCTLPDLWSCRDYWKDASKIQSGIPQPLWGWQNITLGWNRIWPDLTL